jgi:hypothetical protein
MEARFVIIRGICNPYNIQIHLVLNCKREPLPPFCIRVAAILGGATSSTSMSDVNLLMPYSSVTAKPPKHGNLHDSVIAASRS